MDSPQLLSPVAARLIPRIQQPRSPSQSPTRQRINDDILSDLSPATTLEAFTTPSGKLRASVEAASPSERAFGIRATIASKKIQEWLDELSRWTWPADGGSVGFEVQPAKKRNTSLDPLQVRNGRHGAREDEEQYMGSLLAHDVIRYETRVEEIREDMDDLHVEDIKSRVLDSFSARSRPSSSQSSVPMPSYLSSYTRMEDFTAVVTATVLQALPNLSRLMRLMEVWSIRLAILRRVPPLMTALEDAEIALKSGWEAIRKFDQSSELYINNTDENFLSRATFDIMKNVLQDKVTVLGQDLDFMLDTLEGREDTIPDSWLDRMEVIEQEYGEWVVSADRKVRESEWAKMARARKQVEDEEKAKEAQEAAERRRIEEEKLAQQEKTATERKLVEEERVAKEARDLAELQRIEEAQIARETEDMDEERRIADEQADEEETARNHWSEVSRAIDDVEDEAEKRWIEDKRAAGEDSTHSEEEATAEYVDHAVVDKTLPLGNSSSGETLAEYEGNASRASPEVEASQPVFTASIPESSTTEIESPPKDIDSENGFSAAAKVIASGVTTTSGLESISGFDECTPEINQKSFDTRHGTQLSSEDIFEADSENSINDTHREDNLVPSSNFADTFAEHFDGANDDQAIHGIPEVSAVSLPEETDTRSNAPESSINSYGNDLTDLALISSEIDSTTPEANDASISEDQVFSSSTTDVDSIPSQRGSLDEIEMLRLKDESVPINEYRPITPPIEEPPSLANLVGTAEPTSRQDNQNLDGPRTPKKTSRINRPSSIMPDPDLMDSNSVRTPQSAASSKIVVDQKELPSRPIDRLMGDGANDDTAVPGYSNSPASDRLSLTPFECNAGENCDSDTSEMVPSFDRMHDSTNSSFDRSFSASDLDDTNHFNRRLSPIYSPRLNDLQSSFDQDIVLPSIETDTESFNDGSVLDEEYSQLDGSFVSQPDRRRKSEHSMKDIRGDDSSFVSEDSMSGLLTRNSEESRPVSICSDTSTVVTGRLGSAINSPKKHSFDDTTASSPTSDADTFRDHSDLDPPSPSAGRFRKRVSQFERSPTGSPQPSIPRYLMESPAHSPSPDMESLPSIFDDVPLLSQSKLKSPSKGQTTDDQMQQQISSILEHIPARICLSSDTSKTPPATYSVRSKKSRPSLAPNYPRPHSSMSTRRSSTPFLTLAPAYAKNPRPRPNNGNPEIKVYHLSRSTGEAPIKLFVRLVGENGERVMVRVGGGWADLGEYLKEYAAHHGRRSGSGIDLDNLGKVEIQDLPPRMLSSGSYRSGRDSPAPRPATAMERPRSSMGPRKPRKSLGVADETSSLSSLRSPSTPLPAFPERSLRRSSGAAEDRVSLGLAGPNSKRKEEDLSAENVEWVEGMKEKVKQASAEKEKKLKEKERKEKFGEIDRIGATKRIFPKMK